MEYRTFGRTGLEASVAGIGAGGASRLGLAGGSSYEAAVTLVRRAFELGVNYFDTAESYGTEALLGEALAGRRAEVVFATKVRTRRGEDELLDAPGLAGALDDALGKLRTEFIDVFHLHRVHPRDYRYCLDELVPELERQRALGKIRFLGITESTSGDARHTMLARAVEDDCWDVLMTVFNVFNQSARHELFVTTQAKGIGVEIMAAARTHFSRDELFAEELLRLASIERIPRALVDPARPLALLEELGVASVSELSYRFAAHEPGVGVVLIGTGSVSHLEENLAALAKGPLDTAAEARVIELLGGLSETVFVPGRELRDW